MEEGAGRSREERKWAITRDGFVKEVKKSSYIAAPMVAVSVLQYLLQVVSVIMVGHLGDQLALSSVAIATSLTNVVGFSLLVSLFPLSILRLSVVAFQSATSCPLVFYRKKVAS